MFVFCWLPIPGLRDLVAIHSVRSWRRFVEILVRESCRVDGTV